MRTVLRLVPFPGQIKSILVRQMKKACVVVILGALSGLAQAEEKNGYNAVTIDYLTKSGDHDGALGLGFYSVRDSLGLYGNFYFPYRKREPFYDNLNVNSFGDPVVKRFKEVMLLNVGLTKELFSGVAVYGGVGYAWGEGMAKKYDPMHILGSGGTYYVNDPQNDASGVNGNFGLLVRLGSGVVNAGYNTYNNSVSIGFGAAF